MHPDNLRRLRGQAQDPRRSTTLVLAAFFEWGVASHDLDFETIEKGEKSKEQLRREVKGMLRKGRQRSSRTTSRGRSSARRRPEPSATIVELAVQSVRSTLAADFPANVIRNVWAYAIIFCGHFPDRRTPSATTR
jgi:NADPH-dependent stearoyl-CoA 9-desaturase